MKKNPMKRLWELAENEHRRLKSAIFLSVLGVLGGMAPYFSASKIIIGLLGGDGKFQFYLKWCLIALIGYTVKSVFYSLALSLSHKATFNTLKEVREKILVKLPKMPLGTIIDTPSGEMKQIIVDQVESMETPIAHLMPEMTSNILGPICILIYLFILDWRMALLSLISIPLGMMIMMGSMKNYAKDYQGSVQASREMNSTIVEYVGGIEVIKAYNQGDSSYGKFKDKVIANASYFYHWMKSVQWPMAFYKAITPTTLITILPVGWYLYLKGTLPMESFITTIILSLGIAGPILAAMNFTDSLARVGTIVGSVDSILLGQEQIHFHKKINFDNYNIKMEQVVFGYKEEEVLHGISLNIPQNTLNALVGPSGSGKSTIAKLIAGYWDIENGSIEIGGVKLSEIPLEQLYDLVSFVSQDNFLFDESILENIRMGNVKATDEEVKECAKLSGCHEFIIELENGYHTVVGSGGSHLSGGERQRIAIARAMLKNAPIVIFDEATAYIDPENEMIIQKAVAKLIENKTVIVIAHRLSTIIDADRIFVIDEGKVSDFGNHKELLENSKLYNSMWRSHMGAKDGEEIA